MTEPLLDIGGHDLGAPARVVAVRSKDDLRAALADARSSHRPFAATGLRASYWHNLSLEGAVVADMTSFDGVVATEEIDGYVTVQSGISLRRLDEHLRAHGGHLPMHPDAYGDTPVGASFANGVTAGIGMLWGTFADQVLGLEVMLADGTTLQIGSSRILRAGRGAIASGLPDLRSLFFGAEGALGIVTEIDFALVPSPWEARLTWRVDEDRFSDVLASARYWRRRGCVETMRWIWEDGGELTASVTSRVSEAELHARVSAVRTGLAMLPEPHVHLASAIERAGRSPDYERKWPGPPGSTWARGVERPFAGLDAFVPYGRATEAWAWARSVTLAERHEARTAAYFGGDGVNIGLHCAFADEAARARGRAALQARMAELATFDAVPYRPGVVWMKQVRAGLDPGTLSALHAVGRCLDPEHRIPGTGVLLHAEPDGRRPR